MLPKQAPCPLCGETITEKVSWRPLEEEGRLHLALVHEHEMRQRRVNPSDSIAYPIGPLFAPTSGDVALSTGTVIKHRRMPNGAQEAFIERGGEMSSAEWEEYCETVKNERR